MIYQKKIEYQKEIIDAFENEIKFIESKEILTEEDILNEKILEENIKRRRKELNKYIA